MGAHTPTPSWPENSSWPWSARRRLIAASQTGLPKRSFQSGSILSLEEFAANGPPIALTDKTREHIHSLAQSSDEMQTVVDDETWDKMVVSFEATPERKQHKWRYRLSGSDGSSIVKRVRDKFIDHNATTGKPQEVFKMSDMAYGECMPLNERTEHAAARHNARRM